MQTCFLIKCIAFKDKNFISTSCLEYEFKDYHEECIEDTIDRSSGIANLEDVTGLLPASLQPTSVLYKCNDGYSLLSGEKYM